MGQINFFVVPCRDPTALQPFCWVVSRLANQQPGLWLSRCSTGFWVIEKKKKCPHGKHLHSQALVEGNTLFGTTKDAASTPDIRY